MSTLRCLILAAVVALVAACLIVRRASIEEIERTADSVTVISPVKAHLLDGTTVLYPDGVTLARNILSGDGTRYDLALRQLGPAPDIPLDSVLGLETYQSGVNGPATIGVSLLATVGTIALSVAIYCATDPKCFGSCPTFYSDSAGTAVLEAEGFSYSVAPLFESRDVDRLRLRAGPTGAVRLEVRNEAYETHYLNQLELL